MEIIVAGRAEKSFKADMICLRMSFNVVSETYEKAIDKGTAKVKAYFDMLERLGFKSSECETANLQVRENIIYDRKTGESKKQGFVYIQDAHFEFDYDMKKLAQIMEETANGNFEMNYGISFKAKDAEKIEVEMYKDAFENAKHQAEIIASAAGLKLKACVKASSESFDEDSYHSRASYAVNAKTYSCDEGVGDRIAQVFIPEDVVVSQEIYTIWVAE